MNYFQHLKLNLLVAAHALLDFLAHFIHGIAPMIKISHTQPKKEKRFANGLINIELTESQILLTRTALLVVMERYSQFGIPIEDFLEIKYIFEKLTKSYQEKVGQGNE